MITFHLEIQTLVSPSLQVWFLSSRSQSKTLHFHRSIRWENHWFWFLHQNPFCPNIPKSTNNFDISRYFSFLGNYRLDFRHQGVNQEICTLSLGEEASSLGCIIQFSLSSLLRRLRATQSSWSGLSELPIKYTCSSEGYIRGFCILLFPIRLQLAKVPGLWSRRGGSVLDSNVGPSAPQLLALLSVPCRLRMSVLIWGIKWMM